MGSSCSSGMMLSRSSEEGSPGQTQTLQQHPAEPSTAAGLSPEEIRKLEKRAAAEVKKVLSFKVPVQRVSFNGFKAGLTLIPNTKPPEEIQLEMLASYLPQHLLFNMKQVYLGGSSSSSLFQSPSQLNLRSSLQSEGSSNYNPLEERRTAMVPISHHHHHYHMSTFETLVNNHLAHHDSPLHLQSLPLT
ncbi:hypothetical protein C9374_002894 [Naegleria lovaniensis]|uniref:Uncharacterized protein n=1 Tax=Naegleria lovaniensis TaxID=51637 RepID=A0AA88GN47_NAELO|nr:uncharacterized protein C9374_002894 [Naegleria lovaniensis]KAG2385745.1 hypothetical protein C9374_002894 [Naegleria lovaniensis]